MNRFLYILLTLVLLLFCACSGSKKNISASYISAPHSNSSFAMATAEAHLRESYLWLATTPVKIFAKHSGKVVHGHRNSRVEQQPYYEGNRDQYWKLLPTNEGWIIYQWNTNNCIRGYGGEARLMPFESRPDRGSYSDENPSRAGEAYRRNLEKYRTQFWKIEKVEQGFYVISQNGLAIDIKGNSNDVGADAILWSRHNGDNQRFTFVSAEFFSVFASATETSWSDNGWADLRKELCEPAAIAVGIYLKHPFAGYLAHKICESINEGIDNLVAERDRQEASKQDAHVKEWKEFQKAEVERAIKKAEGGAGRPWANDGAYTDSDIRQSLRNNGKG